MLRNLFVPRTPSAADLAYNRAMAESGTLIRKMRECSDDRNPIRAIMADIWAQSHNVPYVATVYESVQEMNAATAYKAVTDSEKRKV